MSNCVKEEAEFAAWSDHAVWSVVAVDVDVSRAVRLNDVVRDVGDDRMCWDVWTLSTQNSHPDSDDDKAHEWKQEEQTIDDGRQSAPLFGDFRFFLKRLLTTRYLQQISSL